MNRNNQSNGSESLKRRYPDIELNAKWEVVGINPKQRMLWKMICPIVNDYHLDRTLKYNMVTVAQLCSLLNCSKNVIYSKLKNNKLTAAYPCRPVNNDELGLMVYRNQKFDDFVYDYVIKNAERD